MTNKEAKDILKKLEVFFDSSFYKNSQEILDALEIGIEAISNKEKIEESKKLEKSNKTHNTDDFMTQYQKWICDQFKS